MRLSLKERGLLSNRIRTVGVPKVIWSPFFLTVSGWVEGSGSEWACDRLKQIKVDFLRKKAGLPPVSKWILRSGKKSRIFGGAIGSLEAWAFKSSWHFERALALINIYTSFYAQGTTYQQAKKFLSGVTALAVPIPPHLAEVVRRGFQLSLLRVKHGKLPQAKPLLSFNPSPSKRAPLPTGSVPEEDGVVDSLSYLGFPSGMAHFHRFIDLYLPVMRGLEPERDWVQGSYTGFGMTSLKEPVFDQSSFLVGRIGLIQEPGYKLRAVANPGRVFQVVLEPLGKFLFNCLEHLPWDCTFQQSKADSAILDSLMTGKKVYSVDLSGATDYFPLDLQEVALRELLPDATDVDLFLEVSRGIWALPSKAFPKTIYQEFDLTSYVQWTKGQPLGLFPSFASFALTHGILLQGLLGRPWNGEFFILGDDVVILEDELYQRYRETLDLLDCPVSGGKTLESSQVAEFRSIVFTDGRKIPQFKWREVSDDSFLDIVRNIPSLYPLLLPRQRAVVDAIAGLPEAFGGLGWNPHGLSMEERTKPFLAMLNQDYQPVDRQMGYTGLVRTLLYRSSISYSASARGLSVRTDILTALDQRARLLVSKFLGKVFVPLYEILGRNLDLVLEGNLNIPVPGFRLSRSTSLDRWETILGKLDLLPK